MGRGGEGMVNWGGKRGGKKGNEERKMKGTNLWNRKMGKWGEVRRDGRKIEGWGVESFIFEF